MRQLFTFLLAFATGIVVHAQKFDVDTIQMNGPTEKMINIVFLGDGYTESELNRFLLDVQKSNNAFFQDVPFKQYKNYFNVFAISVASNESGAARDPYQPIDNYFGSTFNYLGIDRLLYPVNYSKIVNVLADNFPVYDIVAMIVNDDKYGGSGGWLATFSTNESSNELYLHELGHSFGELADEYWAGPQYAFEKVNLTRDNDPETIGWKSWLNDFNIGIYPHEEAPDWFRPHQRCKMRYLGYDFCAVCVEGLIEKIHATSSPVLSYSPAESTITETSYPLVFNLDLIEPIPNTLRTEWILNNSSHQLNADELTLSASQLKEGINSLSVSITDTTQLVRSENPHTIHQSVISWEIDAVTSVKDLHLSSKELTIDIYPNPFQEYITVYFKEIISEEIKIEVVDLSGKLAASEQFSPGDEYTLNLNKLNAGNYILNIYLKNSLLTSTQIIKK